MSRRMWFLMAIVILFWAVASIAKASAAYSCWSRAGIVTPVKPGSVKYSGWYWVCGQEMSVLLGNGSKPEKRL